MFRFPLQSVLDVKIMLEDLAQTEWTNQKKALEREQEELLAIQERKSRLIETLRETRGRKVTASEIALSASGVEHCLRSEALQEGRIRDAAAASERKREALVDAARNRKAMETLKEKMALKHRDRIGLVENAAMDEMAIVRDQRREKN